MFEWFANPSLLWLGLLAGPVILLFMLRHKPVVKRVPTTLLWAGAAQLNVATSPFSRLRKSLSLLLMLLLLLCLVLALAGLRIPNARTRGLPLVLVIDTTASMQAATLDGTRLDVAKTRASDLIDAAGDCPITLLTWNGSLLLAAPADCEPSVARASLGKIAPSDHGASDEALLLALKPHFESKRKQRVALIADHKPGSAHADYIFIPAGAPAANAGFVAAGVSDAGAGAADLFFGIELHGAERQRVTIRLERVIDSGSEPGYELADVRDVTLAQGQRGSATFRIGRAGLYRARIEQDDALAADNTAFVRHVASEKLRVSFVGPPSKALEELVAAVDFVRTVDASSADAARTAFVYSQSPHALPRLPAALLGPKATLPGLGYSRAYDASEFAARPSRSFLWRGAGVPDIRLGAACNIETREFLLPLLEAGSGTCMGLAPRGQSDLADLVLGFDLDHETNNFRSKYAFVILWSNWFEHVRSLLEPLPLGAVRTTQATELVKLDGRGEFGYERLGGDGRQIALPGDVLAMDRIGVYRFSALAETSEPLVGVSLLDPQESNTALTSDEAYEPDKLAEQLAAFTQSAESTRTDYDLRPWLALAGLALLLFDWFWFRRRFPLQVQPERAVKTKRGVTALRKRKAGA
ncbi:MAG: VWA domain-containing protein [Planctomycetes bacterium]|nr:VWA domain-containing protein [Planctomycetota bacterium]